MESVAFGHLGDYHLHVNLLPHSKTELTTAFELYARIMQIAIESGGTVSAEHGIGKIKVRYLEEMYGKAAVEGMMRTKAALDHDALLSPGNLFTRE